METWDEPTEPTPSRSIELLPSILHGDPNNTRPNDFDVAKIARVALQAVVDRFNVDAKPSMLQRMKTSTKSAKEKATKVLEDSIHGDFNELP